MSATGSATLFQDPESALLDFIRQAPVAVALLDHDLRYVAVSRAYARVTGEKPAALLGRAHYDHFPETPEAWREKRRAALRLEPWSE